jgi:integrase
MTSPKVSLYWYCKTDAGWKRLPAAMGRNRRVRPRFAQVGKAQKFFESGHYELRYRLDGKMVWENVGEDAAEAFAKMKTKAEKLDVGKRATDAGLEIVEEGTGHVRLADKAREYLERQEARGKAIAANKFGSAIEEFRQVARVTYLDELTEQIVLRWYAALRKNGNAPRTIYNKHRTVFGFLKWAKVDTKKLAEKAPSYTKREVEIYGPDELKTFFASISDNYYRVVFETLLKTGLRMQEGMFLEWADIDFARSVILVREKDDLGFTIKDRAGRTVPIPVDLVKRLKTWKESHGGRLVLGTSNDTPNWKWLTLLKRLARNAGLNCGHCVGCRSKNNECERWFLHKFRATYTTNLLRAGIDARTVMLYTGHSDLETVMRYLSPAEGKDTQSKVNAIKWM